MTFDVRSLLPSLFPHVIALAVMFFAVSALLGPALFENQVLKKPDVQNNIGMAKEARDLHRMEGQMPHWTDAAFGGMPTIQISGADIATAPKRIWGLVYQLMPIEVGTMLLAMMSAYVLGLCLGLSPWLSLLLALGFGLSSLNFLYLGAGHATKMRAIATMPGVVAGAVMVFRGQTWRGAGIAAFFAALHLHADHLQMTYYLLFMLLAVTAGAWIHAGRQGHLIQIAKSTGILLLAGVLSVLPQIGQLSLTEQYSEFTTRGKANVERAEVGALEDDQGGLDKYYMLEYSFGRGEFWSIVVPDIKGGKNRLYWGEQRFSGGAFYFGALAFALCLAWLIAGTHWLRWPLLALSILAIALSWRDASWVTAVFMKYVPLFNKFRDTKMMMVLVQLVVPLGAAMALHEMTKANASKSWKKWVLATGASSLMLLAFWAAPEVFFAFKSTIRPDMALEQMGSRVVDMRIEVFRADVLRSLGLTLLATLAATALVKQWLDARWVILGVIAIVSLEMIQVNQRYIGESNFTSKLEAMFPFEATKADQVILAKEKVAVEGFEDQWNEAKSRWEDRLDVRLSRRYARVADAAAFEVLNASTHFRVFDVADPFNSARTSFFHKSVGGYHGAKLRRFQEFINAVLGEERTRMISSLQAGNFNLNATNYPGLAMLNTRYVLVPGSEQPLPFSGGYGPAWFVDEVRWVDNSGDEVSGVTRVNPKTTAVIHDEFKASLGQISAPGRSEVTLQRYHPEGSTYRVSSDRGGLLVLSEIDYPIGWTASVDGNNTELIRANGLLRALKVPAGVHKVELHFEPAGWGTAKGISRAGSLLWLILLGFCFWRGRSEIAR